MPKVFNDDEPVEEHKEQKQVKKQEINLADSVKLELVPMSKVLKLPKDDSKHFPFMCKLVTQEDSGEGVELDRAPVDIICVIDRSGSMNWDNKWNNVVQTMNDLVGFLQPEDRLCICSFNSNGTRDTTLIRMNEEGKAKISSIM